MFERNKKNEPGLSHGAAEHDIDRPVASESRESTERDMAVIGRSIHITGDLRGEEDLRIEGDVSGTIQLKNHSLTIGKEGRIKADVYAKVVTVDGSMEGDLFGSERVSIRKTAQVNGNVTAPRVSLEDGARFKGSIEMDPEAVNAAVGKPQAAKPAAAAVAPAPPVGASAIAAKPTVVKG